MARPQKYPVELIEKAAARVAAGERVEDVAYELKCDPSGLRRKIKELVPAAREAIAKGVDAGRAVAKLPQSIQRDVRSHIDKLLLLQGVLTDAAISGALVSKKSNEIAAIKMDSIDPDNLSIPDLQAIAGLVKIGKDAGDIGVKLLSSAGEIKSDKKDAAPVFKLVLSSDDK
jgi:hypothetical protein